MSDRWIPVEQELPDDNLEVDIYAPECGDPVSTGYREAGTWYLLDAWEVNVTHWQPRPEPPQAAEDPDTKQGSNIKKTPAGGGRNNTGSDRSEASTSPSSEAVAVHDKPAPVPPSLSPEAGLAAEDVTDDEDDDAMPEPDPHLLALANRMLSARLDGVAHALRGSGLPGLAEVTGGEDLQPHVAALTGAYQMTLADLQYHTDALSAAFAALGKIGARLGVDGLPLEHEAILDAIEQMHADHKNACALAGKLQTLLDSKTHECEALRQQLGQDGDPVNHPAHYQTEAGIECIDAIAAALGKDGFEAYCRGNALKYLWRAGKKGNARTDMDKADWYIRRAA